MIILGLHIINCGYVDTTYFYIWALLSHEKFTNLEDLLQYKEY